MQNLAGHKDSTSIITKELQRCDINVVNNDKPLGEPQSLVYGRLNLTSASAAVGEFIFQRAWYYYIVRGKVPLDIAWQLYDDPVGRTDIRVAGHCECPEPTYPWVTYISKDGKYLRPHEEYKSIEPFLRNSSSSLGKIARKINKESIFVLHPEMSSLLDHAYVNLYHIDSELGLYKFVQAIRG